MVFLTVKLCEPLKVLVEDFKEIETEYALVGYSDGKEVIIPALLKLLVVSKKNKGIALQGEVFPVDGFEELTEKFKTFVLEMGFVGLFDIDFYKSGGVIYFCEMNLRFGGSGYAVTRMGVNLPAMMVKSFMGDSISEIPKSISGRAVYVNDRMCMEDFGNGFISARALRRFRKDADISFVFDADDCEPEKRYRYQFRRQIIIWMIKRLVRC